MTEPKAPAWRARRRLVERLRDTGIRDERVLAVMQALPRHWFVDDALAYQAYENNALPIGFGQTISQPYIVARMTEVLLAGGVLHKVLEIGTGSAYQTAVLAPLVEQLYSIERLAYLYQQAQRRIQKLGLRNVHLKHGDGYQGWAYYAPYDGILLTAAPETVPTALLQQLAVGGRLLAPVGAAHAQALVLIERKSEGFVQQVLEPVSFVPLLGGVL